MEQTAPSTLQPSPSSESPQAGLSEGRLVHYVMVDGQIRPAIVVRVWDRVTGCCNLQVFVDGSNDGYDWKTGTLWATSIPYDEGLAPQTWHWPERT